MDAGLGSADTSFDTPPMNGQAISIAADLSRDSSVGN